MEAINSLGINAKLLIAQIVNFLILLFLLKKFLYGPVVSMLDKRSATIKKSLDDAKKIEEEVKKTEAINSQTLTEAKAEAKIILEDARKSASEEAKKITEAAEKRSGELKDKALLEIDEEKDNAKKEIRREAASLIALATSQIINQKLDEKADQELISETIKQL